MSGLRTQSLRLLFIATIFLGGCNQQDFENQMGSFLPRSPSASRTLDLGFSPITSAGLLATAICEDKRFISELEGLGWSLNCTPVFSGAEIRSGIEDGWLDLGVLEEQSASAACSAGIFNMLSIADQSYSSLITTNPALVHELKEMTLGIPLGSYSQNSIRQQMKNWSMEYSSNKIQTLPIDELPRYLQRHKVDAILSWEPLSSLAMEDHPDWHYLFRIVGISYWAAHPLLRQDTSVSVAFLRSQVRQSHLLHGISHRLDIEKRRWEYANVMGFPVQAPKSIRMLAEKPTQLSFGSSSFFIKPNALIPASCVDSVLINKAFHQIREEMAQ